MATKRHAASLFTATFFVILILFAMHRALTYVHLNGSVPSSSHAASIMVGLLSDTWVAFLLAALAAIVAWGLFHIKPHIATAVCLMTVALITGALCAHQGYVEFFQFQIEPFHIRYLSDWQFVSSNSASFLTWENAALTAASLILCRFFYFGSVAVKSRTFWNTVLLMIACFALFAHNRNIHYRVQWFIPDNLQTNLLETLYLRSKNKIIGERLKAEAFAVAASKYNMETSHSDQFERTLFAAAEKASDDGTGEALRQAFSQHVTTGKSPVIIVLLLESLRPSEVGVFAKTKPSLTPFIDSLALEGILFSRAFSTGSVTRGGQEAVLCGNASGRSTSLMRNYDNLPYECLTDQLSKQSVHLFWYHGGDGRFDDQEIFWKRHQIRDLMTINSFPTDAPMTGWGVGDKFFFAEAAKKLLTPAPGANFGLGMILSVTNHIPWRLPEDYSGHNIDGHPSWKTTRYTDEAVETLVRYLKEHGRWDSTLLFIVSDHGNKVPPYAELYDHSKNREQLLQSHITMIMAGGLTTEALTASGRTSAVYEHLVSQTDVAATIARISGASLDNLRIMGKSLFDLESSYPVISQTEDGVYVPALDRMIPYTDVVHPLPDPTSDDWIYRFHFQAVNEYLITLRSMSR